MTPENWKALKKLLNAERKDISRTYGRINDPYARGLPRSSRFGGDPGVCVYFMMNGKQTAMPCDTYTSIEGNIAAIAAHIEATRAMERHGVASVDEMFAGFAALPPPEGSKPSRPWWEVLGLVEAKYPKDTIEAIYKARVKVCHPDAGGTAEAFQELVQAREDVLQ